MRVMAIDYGDVRTGLAISDESGFICGDAFTITEKGMEGTAARIVQEARSRGVARLVLGLPRNMDGSEGPRAEKSRRLAALLEKALGEAPVLWDERRSTVEAHAILSASGRKMRSHKSKVDAVAASLILDGYLGSLK